jgi:predicted peroxiredoxin
MTDKELLTLAAKAAGIEVTHYVFGKGLSLANPKEGMQILPRVWNPLNSDADALRLAVKI